MQTGMLFIAAILLLAVALYAHRQIAFFTQGSANIFVVRSILLIVGMLFGWISTVDNGSPLVTLLRFLIGFGVVHIPAAVILFIKGQRGAGKS